MNQSTESTETNAWWLTKLIKSKKVQERKQVFTYKEKIKLSRHHICAVKNGTCIRGWNHILKIQFFKIINLTNKTNKPWPEKEDFKDLEDCPLWYWIRPVSYSDLMHFKHYTVTVDIENKLNYHPYLSLKCAWNKYW